jgi:hypothetical protein
VAALYQKELRAFTVLALNSFCERHAAAILGLCSTGMIGAPTLDHVCSFHNDL